MALEDVLVVIHVDEERLTPGPQQQVSASRTCLCWLQDSIPPRSLDTGKRLVAFFQNIADVWAYVHDISTVMDACCDSRLLWDIRYPSSTLLKGGHLPSDFGRQVAS